MSHGLFVRCDTRLLVHTFEIPVEVRDGVDITALPLSDLSSVPSRSFRCCGTEPQLLDGAAARRHRIVPAAGSNSPMCHRASRVRGEDVAEGPDRRTERE